MCGPGHSRRLGLTLLTCCALAWPARAFASEAPSDGGSSASTPADVPTRSGESREVRLSIGGANAAYTQHDDTIAEFNAVSIDAALRLGWFLNEHFLLGLEVVGGHHIGVSEVQGADRRDFPSYATSGNHYTVVAPFGAFFELYPIDAYGVYLGASAGVGVMFLPAYADAGSAAMAHYGFELGYDMSGTGKQGLGWFARYDHWAAIALISDHKDELQSHDVSVGARWSFF